MSTKRAAGTFEEWRLPGGEPTEEPMTATEMKDTGAFFVVGSSVRRFRVEHVERVGGDNRYPWKLLERHVVGTERPSDWWEPFDEFASCREAISTARRLAAASVIAGSTFQKAEKKALRQLAKSVRFTESMIAAGCSPKRGSK